MLDKRLPKIYSHITSLKDVRELTISTSKQEEEIKIICPISMIEFSGLNSFYFFWNCGCLISKKAFDELQMKDNCLMCGKKFDKEKDIIDLNHTKEERAQIFQRLIIEKIKEKKSKDEKKLDKNVEKKEKDLKKHNENKFLNELPEKKVNLYSNNNNNNNTDMYKDNNKDNAYGLFKMKRYFGQDGHEYEYEGRKENKNNHNHNHNDINENNKLEFINKKRKRS